MKTATKIIKFRVNEGMHKFLKDLCKDSGIEMSELLRNIVSYFFMSYTLGDWKKPLPELRKEFMGYLNSLNSAKKGHKTI